MKKRGEQSPVINSTNEPASTDNDSAAGDAILTSSQGKQKPKVWRKTRQKRKLNHRNNEKTPANNKRKGKLEGQVQPNAKINELDPILSQGKPKTRFTLVCKQMPKIKNKTMESNEKQTKLSTTTVVNFTENDDEYEMEVEADENAFDSDGEDGEWT